MDRETAWTSIFAEHNIISKVDDYGHFDITASQINDIGGPDARVMAKIDSRENLPSIMSTNKLAILAIRNGVYRIGRFDPFFAVQEQAQERVEHMSFPESIITLNPACVTTESAALDIAAVSGMLERVFGENIELTIRGRTRIGADFAFELNTVSFPVSGVQIEVDGGYEGKTSVNLVEAKIGYRANITLRQILYPQRCWETLVHAKNKPVKSYVFMYQEPLFRFIPVMCETDALPFADHSKEKVFQINEPGRLDLSAVLRKESELLVDPGVPFPQANDFGKVLAMLSLMATSGRSRKAELSLEFDITSRQIDYYYAVLRWMRLCTDAHGEIVLTPLGLEVSRMPHMAKIQALANIVFSEPVFRESLRGTVPDAGSNLWNRWGVNENTRNRRLGTVLSWIDFFKKAAASA